MTVISLIRSAVRTATVAHSNRRWWARYKAHLESDKWARYRQRVFKRDGWKCTGCGSPQALQCHHKTYARMGHERLADCTTLCYECHMKLHRKGRTQ